eukprot:CAMPEP_0171324606 /NCGR_PEP_ID=MMETSP0816-20121228/116291_1 /TAXON_ID=420281 /ORGANISM="Proboscia inermis, Strain CCAP1064/1" /LENGTH=253 /DNA_ID=CAMNT_0011823583 /DNA_START=45 /DNA_END=807 /DNA_ORIENTATION=-
MTLLFLMLLLNFLQPTASLAFMKINPLKAAMLTKNWQGLLAEVDQKVGVVPELGGTSVGMMRFGPELERRTLCKRQFERFHEANLGLALADKENEGEEADIIAAARRYHEGEEADIIAAREAIPVLRIAGYPRGARCCVYACLTSPATMTLLEQGCHEDEVDGEVDGEGKDDNGGLSGWWSVLGLTVNPTERDADTIIAAEVAALSELCGLVSAGGGKGLRVETSVKATLAGGDVALGLSPLDKEGAWHRCEL